MYMHFPGRSSQPAQGCAPAPLPVTAPTSTHLSVAPGDRTTPTPALRVASKCPRAIIVSLDWYSVEK